MLLSLLAGCAGQQVITTPLPKLSELPEIGTQRQRLTFHHQGRQHQLIGILQHDQALRLVMLNAQGQRLLTLVHDDDGSRFLHDTLEPPFSAEWLASRLSWSLWPASALSHAFSTNAWSLSEDHQGRTIRYATRVIARISGDAQCRLIEDFEADYRLYIAPLDDDSDRIASPCPAN